MKRSPHTTLLAAIALAAGLGLSACTSSKVLEPSALVGSDAATNGQASPPFALPPPGQAGTAAAPGALAAISTDARVQFAPVVGAPANASTPLAARLSARATARGIPLVSAGESSATHVMKGYFSAISDGGQTTVIYVWDVIDPAGTRVHRIQGQAKAPGTAPGGDGWDGVQPATMEAIADETIDRLATWLTTQQG